MSNDFTNETGEVFLKGIVYSENFWQGCAALVFYWIPFAKENLVENIPLAEDTFLILSPFLYDFKEF